MYVYIYIHNNIYVASLLPPASGCSLIFMGFYYFGFFFFLFLFFLYLIQVPILYTSLDGGGGSVVFSNNNIKRVDGPHGRQTIKQ